MINFFTKENITFILAVIGSIGTISGWLYHWVTTRKNLSMRIVRYELLHHNLLVYFHLTNNSLLNITINDISFSLSGIEYHCLPFPEKIIEITYKSGSSTTGKEDFYSKTLPISLSPLCGCSGYLEFPFDGEIQLPHSRHLTFVIRTNRGMAMKKTLLLEQGFDD